MFGFLQGLAYGLFLSCPVWFVVGMFNPGLVVPTEPPGRWQVILRYWFAIPFIAFLLWVTSLWGGFGPSLGGWLAGLLLVPATLPLERHLRRWWGRHAERQAERRGRRAAAGQGEAGLLRLDGTRPPGRADEVVRALWDVRQRLDRSGRADLALHADRVYTRYHRLFELLAERLEPGELTLERSRALVGEVCRGAVDTLQAMASRVQGLAGMDTAFIRRRLASGELGEGERAALERRLRLVREAEREIAERAGRIEGVLTALDATLVAVSRLETGRPYASTDAGRALEDLRRFGARAGQYRHGAVVGEDAPNHDRQDKDYRDDR